MDNLDLLINVIINNTRLSYADENKLMLDEDKAVMEIIKVIASRKYENRLEDLKREKEDLKNKEEEK